MDEKKTISDLIREWSWSMEFFVREALKVENPTDQQIDGMRKMSKLVNAKIKAHKYPGKLTEEEKEYAAKKGISIMAGKGTGKEAFCAWAVLWFLCCFPFPKIPCTAPTAHQLKDIFWAEISKWMRSGDYVDEKGNKKPGLVSQLIKWQAESVFMKQHKGKEWFAVARTANPKASSEDQEETLSGFHEDFLLFIVDEASGVKNPVFKPIEGTMTGICNIILMIFNPTRNTGTAVESHRKNRKFWVCLNWSGEDCPLVKRSYIDNIKNKYGEDSNPYRVQVRGVPPKSVEGTLIPWDWIMDAVDREVTLFDEDPVKIGNDIGGGGDPSVSLNRWGPKITDIRRNDSVDTMVVANWIAGYAKKEDPDAMFTDIIGLGRGVYDRLDKMGFYRISYGVNVSKSPSNEEKFFRLRDELYWRLRESFEAGIPSIPNDEDLIGELSVIRYDDTDSRGRIKVEGKKELKKRIGQHFSPNTADAYAMTFYLEDSIISKKANKKKDAYDEDEDERIAREDAYMGA